MEQDDPNAKCFTDPEFYTLELRVLERLKSQTNDRNIKTVCRDLGVDAYDFKDRWGPMLRNHTPTEILEDMAGIRPRVHEPVADIAKDLGLPYSTVRTIVRKLLVTPESNHQRTKENLTHRLIAQSGVPRKEAREQLGTAPRTDTKKDNSGGEDSSSSSEAETPPKKVEKVPTALPERRPPPPRPIKTLGPVWYEQTIALLSGAEAKGLSPDVQLRILEDIHRGTDLQKACQKLGAEVAAFKALWGPFVRLIEPSLLDASVHLIVYLSHQAVCAHSAQQLGAGPGAQRLHFLRCQYSAGRQGTTHCQPHSRDLQSAC